MPYQDDGDTCFYKYIMDLLYEAGHVFTTTPEYINHSARHFVYMDNFDATFNREQRYLFDYFDNVSRLFTVNDCAFFSICLSTRIGERSQIAYEIHQMIHPIVGTEGTICIFKALDMMMFSFMGFGLNCILSDWYPLYDDEGYLHDKLDIANMSIRTDQDYFYDFIYSLAREYYLSSQDVPVYGLVPIDFMDRFESGEIGRDELDAYIQDILSMAKNMYGKDYIEYDENSVFGLKDKENIDNMLNMMILEMDTEIGNPFDEDIEDEFEEEEEQLELDDYESEEEEYDYDDITSDILDDPIQMLRWLNDND